MAAALSGQPELAVWVGGVTLWFLWGAGLLCSLIQTPVALTALRICAPLPILLGLAAVAIASPTLPSPLGWAGLATATLLVVLVFTAELGDGFVNGSSYGDERRMALRPSAAVLFGAVELVWLLTVCPLLAAVWMLASANWIAAGTGRVETGHSLRSRAKFSRFASSRARRRAPLARAWHCHRGQHGIFARPYFNAVAAAP